MRILQSLLIVLLTSEGSLGALCSTNPCDATGSSSCVDEPVEGGTDHHCICNTDFEGRDCSWPSYEWSHPSDRCHLLGSVHGDADCYGSMGAGFGWKDCVLKCIDDGKTGAIGMHIENSQTCCCADSDGDLRQSSKGNDKCDMSCADGFECGGNSGGDVITIYRLSHPDPEGCSGGQCDNGGTCIELLDSDGAGFECLCPPGWEGTDCADSVDDCPGHGCANLGTCVDGHQTYTCDCTLAVGWGGPTCETEDFCLTQSGHAACDNGVCLNQPTEYTCDCDPGWTGTLCDTDIDECSSPADPCENGGVCAETTIAAYACDCAGTGYKGANCTVDVDECSEPGDPCANGAPCTTPSVNDYSCDCSAAPGWTGKNCSEDIDECAGSPCAAGATCNNLQNQYTCTCEAGWTGTDCDVDIDECAPDPCVNTIIPCPYFTNILHCSSLCSYFSAPGNCKDSSTDGSVAIADYECTTCIDGWEGKNCNTDILECASTPCQNNATCNEMTFQYTCTCALGWTDDHCSTEINECLTPMTQTCNGRGTCVDLVGYHYCTCDANSGWEGQDCEIDIDECALAGNPCENGASCRHTHPTNPTPNYLHIDPYACADPVGNPAVCNANVTAGYMCTCVVGPAGAQAYTGLHCENDINECLSLPCLNGGTCNNNEGHFLCDCPTGWAGDDCGGAINECLEDWSSGSAAPRGFPCVTGNHDVTNCVLFGEAEASLACSQRACDDGDGTYQCRCLDGWEGIDCGTDIDECAAGVCFNNATCQDSITDASIGLGNYTCDCHDGWIGDQCENDINECSSYARSYINWPGNPRQDPNGRQDGALWVDTSNQGPHGGNVVNCGEFWRAQYNNVSGGGPNQGGAAGLTIGMAMLAGNDGTDPPPTGTCLDLVGRFECDCEPGFTGTYCELDIDECGSAPCQHNATCYQTYDFGDAANYVWPHQWIEKHQPNQFKCECILGFNGTLCEFEIDECESSPCVNGTCVDLIGEFRCDCTPGYNGTYCDTEINECDSNPCHYNGTCHDLDNAYACDCPNGTTGYNCSVDFPECASNPCFGNSTCIEQVNYYRCLCQPEWTDVHCDLETEIYIISVRYAGILDLAILTDIVGASGIIKDTLPFLVGAENDSTQWKISYEHGDIFRLLMYENVIEEPTERMYKWKDPALGTCFTWNHQKGSNSEDGFNFLTRRAGSRYGLQMWLDVVQWDFLPWIDVAAFRIYIHNQSELVTATSVSHTAPAGFATNLGLVYTEYRKKESPYSDCAVDGSDKKLKQYYSDPAFYNKANCLISCFQKKLLDSKCACVDPRYDHDPDHPVCPMSQRQCLNDFVASDGDPTQYSEEECFCPQGCLFGEYEVSISRTKYIDIPPICVDEAESCTETNSSQSCCVYDHQRNFAVVNVYFENVAYFVYQEVAAYEFMDFLGEAGGQMGILAGVSLISVVEIFICALRICFAVATGKG